MKITARKLSGFLSASAMVFAAVLKTWIGSQPIPQEIKK